jgi:glycerol-3-phosphate dehydrogenase
MWPKGWREQIWVELDRPWDLIVIGGGITGAGVLREASLRGLRALLVEANDFAFGTSGRSSKLVHGGIRYLRERQFNVTRESAREREWLLRAAPHLVNRLPFLWSHYTGAKTHAWQFAVGVILYDLVVPKWDHRHFSSCEVLSRSPLIRAEGLQGAQSYIDASVDDTALVLRLLRAAVADGAAALNYAPVDSLLRTADGQVRGVRVRDLPTGRSAEVQAKVVINAAGPWSDELRAQLNAPARLRKCRGSHLVFSRERLPLNEALSLLHPRDNRAMFIIPWETTTLIGTTDLDHPREWESGEPFATQAEIEYMLEGLQYLLPKADIRAEDIISTFAGLRPLIRPAGSALPSQVSRRAVVWDECGMITITGGKLTIFRIMAVKALQAAAAHLGSELNFRRRSPVFDPLPEIEPRDDLPAETLAYLLGRYGSQTPALLASTRPDELTLIPGTLNPWAELRYAARAGGVLHLDDLLLRRLRLGILLPRGGLDMIEPIRAVVQAELGWDDARWQAEVERYAEIWRRYYSPAPAGVGEGVAA